METLVPVKYRRRSGVLEHTFGVKFPWYRPLQWAANEEGEAWEISPTIPCEVEVEASWVRLALTEARNSKCFEALRNLGSITTAMPRKPKYLLLYKSYEALVDRPEIELSAVRHTISHASTELTRPKTVEALQRLFGGVQIDLDVNQHVATFWEIFARLLIRTDCELHDQLAADYLTGDWQPASYRLVTDYQAKAMLAYKHSS